MKKCTTASTAILLIALLSSSGVQSQSHLKSNYKSTNAAFPPEARSTVDSTTYKPWTYWWWMGSAVTEQGIKQHLEAYQKAGLGGVHIVPLYGVKGEEQNFIPFLSPAWIRMVNYTVEQAKRLGMAVDMTTGTGWPFGGPSVKSEDAAHTFDIVAFSSEGGKKIVQDLKKENTIISAVSAFSAKDTYVDLSGFVNPGGVLTWKAPKGLWNIYVLYQGYTGQYVKRAAPGGEGLTLDPFNKKALKNYVLHFDSAFHLGNFSSGIRAFYNDSYEVYGANWTPGFLEQFTSRRGYDLKKYCHLLADTSGNELAKRVWMDYHTTVSDLLLDEFAKPWVQWAHGYKSIVRYEAHGSPGNLLDLYAAADIPETETFGPSRFTIPGVRVDSNYNEKTYGRPNPLALKLASSAANVAGKRLTGSESCTWLADHFKVALSQVKPQIDELFVSGINHVFFHGMPYSPFEAPFPGWLFYASTNFGQQASFWKELPHLTSYITRCQYHLQHATTDNDILLYFPIHDLWTTSGDAGKVRMLDVHRQDWLMNSSMGELAGQFYKKGYTFDYVSDRQIQALHVEAGGKIQSYGSTYQTIVIPSCQYIPVETLSALEKLIEKGAHVIFTDQMPLSVPGLYEYKQREQELNKIKQKLAAYKYVVVTKNIEQALEEFQVKNETMALQGLSFIRKNIAEGKLYFISNLGNQFKEGEIILNTPAQSVEIVDPLSGTQGLVPFTTDKGSTKLFLQLLPGQSCIIRTFKSKLSGSKWKYSRLSGKRYELKGKWQISFVEGAPQLPAPIHMDSLKSWTETEDEKAIYFSGTARYKINFDLPSALHFKEKYLIDMGDVRETARVSINGKYIGTVWCVPFRLAIPEGILLQNNNTMTIEVTNLSFNRVIDLDKKGVYWKKFHDINFVNIQYKPFDASSEPPMLSGLLGPVQLIQSK